MNTFEKKKKYIDDMYDKYGQYEAFPKEIKKKIDLYTKSIEDNEEKLDNELNELYNSKKIDKETLIKYDDLIKYKEIFTLKDIPMSKSVSKSSKTVSKTSTEDLEKQLEEIKGSLKPKHKKLIKQIPDDVYSKRNILQIILNIYNDHYKSSKDFPEPKEGQTADLSDVIEFKKIIKFEN